jgi:hypothetical protein
MSALDTIEHQIDLPEKKKWLNTGINPSRCRQHLQAQQQNPSPSTPTGAAPSPTAPSTAGTALRQK